MDDDNQVAFGEPGPEYEANPARRTVLAGMIWFGLVSFLIMVLRDVIPDPFYWWFWVGVALPLAVVALTLITMRVVRRWTASL
jgi:hypothetical protein